jgi:hypothetical protein
MVLGAGFEHELFVGLGILLKQQYYRQYLLEEMFQERNL